MKNIKIYLQYPWKFPDSPYYKYLIQSPPGGIEYQNIKKQKGAITSKSFFWFSNFLKRNIRRTASLLNLAIPNAHLSPEGDYDLIHCAHCLSLNKNKPWVADIEHLFSMCISGIDTMRGTERVREILLRKNCKKILPWTEATKNDILKKFPEIRDKVEVVYPSMPFIENLKKPRNRKLKVIFIARYFHIKGGVIALEVLDRLIKKHQVDGIVVSNVPEKLKKEYPRIKIYDLVPQEELFKLMRDSDIFLYPSVMDTFGFSLLEAMNFGLPIMTINTKHTQSRREIVENGKQGFIFDVNDDVDLNKIGDFENDIINRLVENCEILIMNKPLLEKISKRCRKEIKEGKFSVKVRNKNLEKIYGGAIK